MVLQIRQDRSGALAAPISARIYEGRVAKVHGPSDPLRYEWGSEYRNLDGIRTIADQLQVGKTPFTLLHPASLIANGAQAKIIGHVITARVDGDYVVAQILITDPEAEQAIKDGTKELSLGYTSQLDRNHTQVDIKVDHLSLVPRARCGTACALRTDCNGTNDSCPCKVRAISYNTVIVADQVNNDEALNAKQRHELPSNMFAAPESKALPLEDASHVQDAMARFNQTDFKGPAEKKAAYYHIIARAHQLGMNPDGFEKKYGGKLDQDNTMDELQKKLGEALVEITALKVRADAADAALAIAKTALTAAEVMATNAQAALVTEKKLTEAETLRADQAKLDADNAIVKAKLDADGALTTAVTARVQLMTEANAVLGTKEDRSAMSDQAIRLAVIKHVDNLDFPVDKDPVFVSGVYAGSLARSATATASRTEVRQAIAATHVDATTTSVVVTQKHNAQAAELAAKQAMTTNQSNRWRGKLN